MPILATPNLTSMITLRAKQHWRVTFVWFALLCGLLSCCDRAHAQGFAIRDESGSHLAKMTVEAQPNKSSPLLNPSLLLRSDANARYFVAAGLGVPKFNLPDSPLAAAWEVVPDDICASLRAVQLSTVKAADVKPVLAKDAALPYGCAAAFEGACTSRDKLVLLRTRFEGTRRDQLVGGGFYGSEGKIRTTFYSGQRILTIQNTRTRQAISLYESLSDTQAYSQIEARIAYLPEHSIVLLLGLVSEAGLPQAHCVKLVGQESKPSVPKP